MPNEDSYGSPAPNKYISPQTLTDTIAPNTAPIPNKYSAPTDGYNVFLNPRQNNQKSQQNIQATIRVVDPPNNVGQGHFVPSDVKAIQESTRSGKAEKIHPNQLLMDFRPSVRLPDNFVHQIGNMIVDPNR